MSKKLSRRKFIQSTAASTAAVSIPSILHCRSPNSKLNVGLIGVGGRGRGHVRVCLCFCMSIVRVSARVHDTVWASEYACVLAFWAYIWQYIWPYI